MKRHRAFGQIGSFGGVVAAALFLAASGCCPLCVSMKTCPKCPPKERCMEEPWCDYSTSQVQFYSPPGAHVTVGGEKCVFASQKTRSHDIVDYSTYGNRLEQNPEQFATFNLKSGRNYEFKYDSAEGLPGVTVYGELDVKCANSREAKMFQRRGFIPIALPSEYYKKVEVNGPEIYAYRPEIARTAIDSYDLERLKQGDVIEKVFFVVDLKDAEERLNKTQLKVAKLERELELADQRFHCAYLDFYGNGCDSCCNNMCGKSFIGWDQKRVKIKQELASERDKLARTRAVLAGDKVITRRGMLVLATSQTVQGHKDVERAADDIGEVLVVMRVGGRHFHWGQPDPVQLVQENCVDESATPVEVEETVTQ